MKKLFLSVAFSFATCILFAQSGELTNAILAYRDGMLADAQTSIDKASLHEKTKNEAKTWLYKGKIYEAIALDAELVKQNPDAAKNAFDAYHLAQKLDETAEKSGKFKQEIDEALVSTNFAIALQNSGIRAFQGKQYNVAYDYFTMFQEVRPLDTLGYIYAAQMAMAKNDYPKAKVAYAKCIEKTGYTSPEILTNLLYIYQTVESEKDISKALEIARIGKEKYPNSQYYISQEIELLEKSGQIQDAIAQQEALVQKVNKTSDNYLTLGMLYEKNKEMTKAKDAYSVAVNLGPESFEANFNFGAMVYNSVVEIYKQINQMNALDYNRIGKQMESESKEVLKKALTYFEKANQLKPQDVDTKKTLKDIYIKLGLAEKANNIKL